MWPSVRQSLLHTVEYIQAYYETYTATVRRTGIVFVILGTVIGSTVFLAIAYVLEQMKEAGYYDQLVNISFLEGLTLGGYVMFYSASLLSVHMYKGIIPGAGTAYSSHLPPAAKRMFLLGLMILIILFGIYELLQLFNIFRSETISYSPHFLALAKWFQTVLLSSFSLVTAFLSGMVVLKGTGQVLNAATRPAVFAATILLFFWIKAIHSLVAIVNAVVTAPMAGLLPTDGVKELLSAGVMTIIYLFAMIPAAAIAASIQPPVTTITFDAETEK